MKTSRFITVLLSTLMLAGFTACDRNPAENPDPVNPEEKDSFERVMLLEQFTSEHCVNCPNGITQIDAWLKQHSNVIWLAHHAGFSNDQWTISESKTIAQMLGVTGAPQIALDRSYLKATEEGVQFVGYNLHPYYLNFLDQLPSVQTSASIRLKAQCEDGKVQIHVAGRLKEDAPEVLRLTVVIKENGLHGKQEDQFYTLAGAWDDYVHSDVIRTFASSVGGDTIAPVRDSVEKGLDCYAMDYSVELQSNWVPENSMVVAFLTDGKSLNVVQAAETPVVAGTQGGADLQHGGVTPKAVPEGYPEGKYGIVDFLKADTIYLDKVYVLNSQLSTGLREWHMVSCASEQTFKNATGEYVPYSDIVFYTAGEVTAVPTNGEFAFTVARSLEELKPNMAWAGYCDLDKQTLIGTELMLANKSMLDEGYPVPGTNAHWLVAAGKIVFGENGFLVDATSAKGYPIRLKYTGKY